MVGIHNQFSVNNDNKSQNSSSAKNEVKKSGVNINFKGARLVEDQTGKLRHEFYLPNKNYNLEAWSRQNGHDEWKPIDKNNIDDSQNGSQKTWKFKDTNGIGKNTQIAYRFLNGDNKLVDNVERVVIGKDRENKDIECGIAPALNRLNISQPHQLYHLMPDDFNPDKKFNEDGTDIIRTNFNKYDGTLSNITQKLDYIKGLGAARIISTPVIGQDQISSHGYWTTNPYQVTSTAGTIKDFKDLQQSLYKRGMAWVSDGAFVNEGWEGIHLLNLMRYGDDSYAKNWFETYNFPDEKLKAGLLPRDANSVAYKNFAVKIINGPIKITPTGPEINADYNPASKKPTQIQIYDKRLVGDSYPYNDEIIRSYPVKNLKDPNIIKNYQDSVEPYVFEINPDELKEKFGEWQNKNSRSREFKEYLLNWKNFAIVPSNSSGGITLWDGNKDIAKLRFVLPKHKEKQLEQNSFTINLARNIAKLLDGVTRGIFSLDKNSEPFSKITNTIINIFGLEKNDKIGDIKKSIPQVQDYIVQVGGYWTNEVDKTLNEYTAAVLSDNLSADLKNLEPSTKVDINDKKAELIFKAIQELAKTQDTKESANAQDKGKAYVLPEKIKNLVEDGKLTQAHIKNMLGMDHTFAQKSAVDIIDLKQKGQLNDENVNRIIGSNSDITQRILELDKNGGLNKVNLLNLLENKYVYNADGSGQYAGSYNLTASPLPKSITDGLMSYPLDAIEFPREICSILSSPDIKKLATDKNDIGQSRYDFMSNPNYSKTSSTYKKLDSLYKGKISDLVKEVIKESNSGYKILDHSGNLTDNGKEIFRLISGDIVKYIVVKSIADMKPTKGLKEGEALDYSCEDKSNPYKTLGDNTYNNIPYLLTGTSQGAAESVVQSLEEGLSRIDKASKKDLADYIDKRVGKLDPDLVKVSKLLVNKTESGLEWRIDAAKDIADIDSIKEAVNEKTPEDRFTTAWNEVIEFWSKFNKEVRKHNPKSYTIGEVTDVGVILANANTEIKDDSLTYGPFKTTGQAESDYIENAGFTTQTNYSYLFSSLPKYFGADMEAGDHINDIIGAGEGLHRKLLTGWVQDQANGQEGFLRSGPIDNINYSHVSPGNHDKPRLLHGLTLDMTKFFVNNGRAQSIIDSMNITNNNKDKIRDIMSPIFNIMKNGLQDEKDESGSYNWFIENQNHTQKTQEEMWQFVEQNWGQNWLFDAKHSGMAKAVSDAVGKPNLTQELAFEEFKKIRKSVSEQIEEIGKKNPIMQELQKFKDPNNNEPNKNNNLIAAFVMGQTIKKSLTESANKLNISPDKVMPLNRAIDDIVKNNDINEFFSVRPFNYNWEHIVTNAKEKFGLNLSDTDINDLGNRAHEIFLKPGLEKYKAILKTIVCLPGNPTIYGGDELGETGFETKSKNVYVQNRNRLHHEWLEQKDYIKKFNDEISQIFNIRNDEKLSPLVNGYTTVLKPHRSIEKSHDKDNVYALYRYNNERDVIALINNEGFGSSPDDAGIKNEQDRVKINRIDLSDESIPIQIEGGDIKKNYQLGIPGGLTPDVVYKNAFDLSDTSKYTVARDGKSVERLVDGNKQDIVINGPVLLLYRENKFNEQ